MFLVLLMIFDPASGWGRAVESGRTFVRVLLLHLLPLLLLGCAAEGMGMLRWGKPAGHFGALKTYPLAEVLRYQTSHFVVALAVVVACAIIIQLLGNTFQARQKFIPAFTVSVFGLGPVFLMRVCDAFPAINPWLSWGIGAALTVAVLYQGMSRVMRLDPAHALGVYLGGTMLFVLASGIGRVLVVAILQGRILGASSA